ncbi:MAG: rod shape-determining protein MreC [Treponema sp.]|nr:rod shape-determining protein MreC [Treponema sp.]
MQKKPFFILHFAEFLLAFLLILSSAMMSFSSGGFILNFKQIGFNVFSAAQNGINVVTSSIKNSFNAVKELAELRKQYDILTEKLKDYEYMQRTNSDIRKENARLKEQLDFAQSLAVKNYPANIISRGADNLYSTIVLNKGSRNGVRKNMPVIAIQNGSIGIVGKVITVGYTTAQVMPVFDYDCAISARVQNTRDIGLVTGNGSDSLPLKMGYIKKRVIDTLHFGDVIVTSGENENYPADIPIGTISHIKVLDYDTSLAIELEPIIDFSRLEHVLIIDQKSPNDNLAEKEGEEKK